MLNIRVIPALLLKNKGLIKTVKFKEHRYIGDPINAVRIFNEKEVDELLVLDTTATIEGRGPEFKLIADLAGECFMPLGYGGGIQKIDDIDHLFNLGVEKVVLNSHAVNNPSLVENAAQKYGSQSIVVSLDVKKDILGKYVVFTHGGRITTRKSPLEIARHMEEVGAGEIILTSIDCDGTMKGYDLGLINKVSSIITIPLIASGGAGKIEDFLDAVNVGGASAVAAGSMFVYHGRHRAVLINYPEYSTLKKLFTQ